MIATRLPNRAAMVFQLLVIVIWAKCTAAGAASPVATGWQTVGTSSASRSSGTGSASEGAWQLPNRQIVPAAAESQPVSAPDSRRGAQPAPTSPREPRTISAPADAKSLASGQKSFNRKRGTAAQKHSPSSAVTQAAAFFPAGRPAHTVVRPGTQPLGKPRVARSMPPSRGMTNPNMARMRQRMNVATNAAEWSGGSEDLPLPNSASKPVDGADPFGSDPEGYYVDGDQPFVEGGPGSYEGECCDEGCYGECYGGEDCHCGGGCEPGCGCATCDDECCEQCLNDCCTLGPGDPESCNSIRIRVPRWQELAIFGGVQGFKGPYDQERDRGNFGFHEGFNSGFKIPYTYAGYQVGYQAAQSQLNGTESPNSPESHTQHFTTFGLFRRSKDGFQFGSAWDVLVDRRHNTRTYHQIRSEFSWLDNCTHEFGFSATVGVMDHELEEEQNDNENDSHNSVWEAADQYVLFYRVHGKRGGGGRFFGGWTDDSDGILGADMLLPVHDRWSVQTGFTYMIPDARDGEDGSREEAWNINLSLVWHWDCRARSSHNNPYRPLFNVANNGSMIIDSR
jgi:hypothetical protein